jgi:hypothetical protein
MTNQLRSCVEKECLVGYLYEESDAVERRQVEEHLTSCDRCRTELDELRGVRAMLVEWEPPDATLGFRVVRSAAPSPRRSLFGLPVWVPAAAAAVLVLAAAAAIANIEVRYGPEGLVITSGWNRSPQSEAVATAQAPAVPADPAWRTELSALEQRLREELQAQAGPVVPRESEMMRRIAALIEESERRQRGELAFRMGEVVREVEAQRRADLVRIDRGFGLIEGRTDAAVAQQRELLDYFVRVSQQR